MISKYKKIKMTPWRSQLAGIEAEPEETEATDVSSFHLLPSADSPPSSKDKLFAGHFERPPGERTRTYSSKKKMSSKRALLDGYRENMKRYARKQESNELLALTHTHFPRSNFADDLERSFMQEAKPGEPLAVTTPRYNDLAERRKVAKKRQKEIM